MSISALRLTTVQTAGSLREAAGTLQPTLPRTGDSMVWSFERAPAGRSTRSPEHFRFDEQFIRAVLLRPACRDLLLQRLEARLDQLLVLDFRHVGESQYRRRLLQLAHQQIHAQIGRASCRERV